MAIVSRTYHLRGHEWAPDPPFSNLSLSGFDMAFPARYINVDYSVEDQFAA